MSPQSSEPLVLIVDDDDIDATRLKRRIKKVLPVARMARCKDGDEAMDYLRAAEELPDLVFLDLSMPGKLGREVLGEIQADPRLRGLIVIVMSGSDLDADVNKSYDLGARAYVTKQDCVDDTDNIIEQFWLNRVRLPRR